MAKPIVEELQELASDKSNDVADLLRKALIVATKLKIEDFKQWINWELNGYDKTCPEVPRYRRIRGELRVWNPFHGYQPFVLPTQLENEVCNIKYRAPIGNAVSTVAHQTADHSPPQYPLDPRHRNFLMSRMEIPLEPVLMVSVTQLDTVIDAVRSAILYWSLKLEEEGIFGDGMSFSPEEKEKAASSTQIHIDNFQGVLGDVVNSTVNQNLEMSIRQNDFQSVRNYLSSQGVEHADIDELEEAVGSDPVPKSREDLGPRVSDWIGKMVTKAATGAWNMGTSVAGGLLLRAVAAYYGLG